MIDEKKLIDQIKRLEAIVGNYYHDDVRRVCSNLLCELKKFVNAQPKEYRWIPVEERKPTYAEYFKNYGHFICYDGVSVYPGFFDVHDRKFKLSTPSSATFELYEDKRVIAWMRLPEAYNGGMIDDKGEQK